MATQVHGGDGGQFFHPGPHLRNAYRTVDADAENVVGREGRPERLNGLGRQGAPAGEDGDGHHDRQSQPALRQGAVDREHRGFGVQRVENSFDDQQVNAALDKAVDLVGVRRRHLVESRGTITGLLDLGREPR